MGRWTIGCCKAFLGVLVLTLAARADTSYQYAFDQTDYLAAPGGTVAVSVYLVETVSDGGVSVLDVLGVGMASAGVRLHFDDAPQPSDPAVVASTAEIAFNSAFDVTQSSLSAGFADLAEAAVLNDFVHGFQPTTVGTIYWMSIGTFTFTAGTISGETTLLRATSQEHGAQALNATASGSVLDSLITDQIATITTTLYGDANLDGTVNGTDLSTVLSYYNMSLEGENWSHGDFNRDGSVNGTDLNTVLSSYNQTLSLSMQATAAIPEPSTWMLLAIFWSAVIYHRFCRRRLLSPMDSA